MASVQNAPAPPQGGAIIPANLSQAQLQGMLDVCLFRAVDFYSSFFAPSAAEGGALISSQKFKQMRAQGVSPEDPEFVKIHRTLMAVQKQKDFQKQSQIYAQQQAQLRQSQQQQQPQSNGVDGQTTANGVNGNSLISACSNKC